MSPEMPLSLEKLDRELRAAGIEFAALVQRSDGTISLRDAHDGEIEDERMAAVVAAHVPDPPRKRLSARLRERWSKIKPAANATPAMTAKAVLDGFEAFLEEQASDEDDSVFLPMVQPELPPLEALFQPSEEGIAPDEADQSAIQTVAEREEIIEIMALARTIAHEQGVSDAALVSAIVRIAVQEQARMTGGSEDEARGDSLA